jgi:excisionase family DNA binding protein
VVVIDGGDLVAMAVRPRPLTADDVLRGRDVALLLHVPVSTVEDWARRGLLPSVKIGRRRLYIRQKIEEALLDSATATFPNDRK